MTASIIRGDARNLPLPDASVDLVVTSPPYFALRSYTDDGEHYHGQIGAEPTPAEYIAALIACTREWVRVLKPGGSCFVNLGDKYNSAASGQNLRDAAGKDGRGQKVYAGARGRSESMCPVKSLMLLPERYRIACVDELGLIARAVLVWSKPNGLPESVTDRVRRSHEDWVHLVKAPRYYAAVDAIREAGINPRSVTNARYVGRAATGNPDRNDNGAGMFVGNPLGKLPGSVWEIPTEPLTVPDHLGVDHFAAFPTEWPRRLILGWSPSGICTACGEGRRPVAAKSPTNFASHRGLASHRQQGRQVSDASAGMDRPGALIFSHAVTITGEACACTPYTDHPDRARGRGFIPDPSDKTAGASANGADRNRAYRESLKSPPAPVREYHFDAWIPAPTRPAVILDPFGGTGTTALMASVLGRHGISVDMSGDYSRLAQWRVTDPGQRAKAMRVEKPAVQLDGQGSLFEVAG